jgi:hypothetical protein
MINRRAPPDVSTDVRDAIDRPSKQFRHHLTPCCFFVHRKNTHQVTVHLILVGFQGSSWINSTYSSLARIAASGNRSKLQTAVTIIFDRLKLAYIFLGGISWFDSIRRWMDGCGDVEQ